MGELNTAVASIGHRVLSEQVKLLYRQGFAGLVATPLLSVIAVPVLWDVVGHTNLLVWCGVSNLIIALRYRLLVWYRRSSAHDAQIKRWCDLFMVSVLATGAGWGYAGFFLFPSTSPLHQAFVVVIVAGVTGGSVSLLSPLRRICFPFLILVSVPLIARLMLSDDPTLSIVGITIGIYVLIMMSAAATANRMSTRVMNLGFENACLVEELSAANTQERAINDQLVEEIAEREQAEAKVMAEMENAESANRAKSEFLASMSHELRTPMNAILGYAQLLEQDPSQELGEANRKFVDEILRSGHHMMELIGGVLDLAKIENDDIPLETEKLAPGPLIETCLEMIGGAAEQEGVAVHGQLSSEELPMIEVDGLRFKQALLNLLSNAVKYNRPGGQVTVECASAENASLRISVKDTGQGISETSRARVFEPFDRLGAENSSTAGTGIGLSVAKQLVELMRGDIGFESRIGEGTTFWIEVPLAISEV